MKHLLVPIIFLASPQISFAEQTFEGFYSQIGMGYENAKAKGSNTTAVFSDNPSTFYPLASSIDLLKISDLAIQLN